jgi:hypothetical protein
MLKFLCMRSPILLLVLVSIAAAKPVPSVARRWRGPRTVIAGYSSWYFFWDEWMVPVTCNPASSRCDSGDTPFAGGETVQFYSTGTPPQGIWSLYATVWAPYAVCDVQGTSFTLRRNDCSGSVETFTTPGTGSQFIAYTNPAKSYPKNVYVTAVSGLPAGVQLTWWRPTSGCTAAKTRMQGSTPYDAGASERFCLQVHVPPNTPAGDYTVSITFSEAPGGSNSTVLEFPITVVHLPPLQTKSIDWASVPPIPGLDRWERNMVSKDTGGARWCADKAHPTEVMAFGYEGQVWYYDGARVYYQIADYTGDREWANCARNIASQYRDRVLASKGGVQAWRAFPDGLARSMCPSCDPGYGAALQAMINANYYANGSGVPQDDRIREISYSLDLEVMQQKVFGQPHKNLTNTADMVIGFLLSYTEGTGRYAQYQGFMCGLAMEALIGYWDLTHDPRVPFIVKQMLDDIWARYDQKKHALMYDGDVDPTKCGQANTWFNSDPGGGCGANNHQGLNDLVAPAFAWYWKLTGDDTYLQRGDDLFSHNLDEEIYSGKQFSQTYRWSFDYVKWRSGR